MIIQFDDLKVLIDENVLNEMRTFKQVESSQNECGGILLGKEEVYSQTYHIVDISKPNKKDASSRFSFVRNAKAAQKIINKKWKESDGYVNYIGEWHTHPEPSPSPSSVDKKLYTRMSKDKSSPFSATINIIYGNSSLFYLCIYRNECMIYERTVYETQ